MRPKSRNEFAIAIICSLPLEADAVEALFDEHYDRLGKYYDKQRGDANAYINGRIGKHDVVLCYMPGSGKGSAASVASSLVVSYTRIELALVIGICGGAPSPPEYQEMFLGDVIISDSVIEYDFGSQYSGGFQRKSAVKDILGRPNRAIRTILNGLRAENARIELQNQTQQYLHALQEKGTKWHYPMASDILFKASYPHQHSGHASPARCSCFGNNSADLICEEALGKDCNDLNCDKGQHIRVREVSGAIQTSIYIGPVASADVVMKSGKHRDEIVKKEKVIGFEMEGAGVWDNVSCIIIKGVCDYADSHKNKSWQAYAAATGASAAKAFLEYWMPVNHKDASKDCHVMIPFTRNPRFVGRQAEICKLEDLISIHDGAKRLAITGLGGVGKTQVALELAYRLREREPDCSIFWIPCTSHEAVEQACLTIAQMVGIQDMKTVEVKDCIKTYFSQTDTKWLLIFDNADDMDMWMKSSNRASALRDFLPHNSQGQVIFTTRNRKLAVKLASFDVVHIPELDEKTGMEFLGNSLLQKSLLNDHQAAINLLKQLTFLPLAVTQAAAYINANRIGIPDYLLLLQEQEAEVIELLSEDFGDAGRYSDTQNPVAMAWLVSFYQIQKLDQLACDYLSLMACIDPQNIPKSFLPRPVSTKKITDALGLLDAYSFIDLQPGNRYINLHRLVHLATRSWMRREERYILYITRAANRLNEIFPDNNHTNRQLWREYLPHALFLLNDSEFQGQQEQYIDFIENVGTCLHSDGRHSEAEKLMVQVINTRRPVQGSEHPDTLFSMASLASTYAGQGQWNKAEKLEIEVFDICKRALGPEHPSTLNSMANLASTYADQRQWDKAEGLEVQILEITKRIRGPEHCDTLTGMGNLASTYWSQGRWKEAEELEVQVLNTWKRVSGIEDPDTLISMSNLASTYWNQERWEEAENLEVQVLDIRKRVLGLEHPDTLTSMANLTSTYESQGRWKEAEELGAHVLDIRKRVLGPEHPDTLSMDDVLLSYQIQRQRKEIEELRQRS
ncbi:hypothetical protein BDV06DRAFT_23172 [Aspergillus oleicola]